MTRHKVFISYSRKDTASLQAMLPALQAVPRIRERLWYDTQDIDAGDKFHPHILAALDTTCIGIVLISNHFFTSRYIQQHELPYLLRQAEHHAIKLGLLYLTPVSHEALLITIDRDSPQQRCIDLSDYVAINAPSNPLNGCKDTQQSTFYVKLADWMARQLTDIMDISRIDGKSTLCLQSSTRELSATLHEVELVLDTDLEDFTPGREQRFLRVISASFISSEK